MAEAGGGDQPGLGQERAMAALSDQPVSTSWRSWTSSSGGVAAREDMAGTAKADIGMPTRRSTRRTSRVRIRSPKPSRPAKVRV